jgi:hypothetical protein
LKQLRETRGTRWPVVIAVKPSAMKGRDDLTGAVWSNACQVQENRSLIARQCLDIGSAQVAITAS